MRGKIPLTPFSTALSGSAELLETRIRNIFTGPRRTCAPLAALVLLFCLFSVNLVSCQPAQAPAAPAPAPAEVWPREELYAFGGAEGLLEVRTAGGAAVLSLPQDLALYGFPAAQEGPSSDSGAGIPVFCGRNGDLAWAAVNSGPSAGTSLVNVLLSQDGGQTWSRCPQQLALSKATGAGFLTAEHGFVCSRYADTAGPQIYETADGGRTWALVELRLPLELRDRPDLRLTALSPVLDGPYAVFPVCAGDGTDRSWDYSCVCTPDNGWEWDAKQIEGRPVLPRTDLDRDGVPEDLYATAAIDIGFHNLTVIEAGQVVYTETLPSQPEQALFLYRGGDGQDRLLRYTADYIYDTGEGSYSWELFSLEEGGQAGSRVKQLAFNTHFGQPDEDFDPEAIAAFAEEVNDMLAGAVPIISSNAYMWYSEFDSPLQESLWWLDQEPRVFRRSGASLLQDLRDYQAAMTDYLAGRPTVPYGGGDGARGALRAFLDGEATFCETDIGRNIDFAHIREGFSSGLAPSVFTVLDMDGDGEPELLFQSGSYRDWTLVIHYDASDGELRGQEFYIRSLGGLKADGTFDFSSSAADSGVGRLRFTQDGCQRQELLRQFPRGDSWSDMVYQAGGRDAAQAEFSAAWQAHWAQPDAAWYDITPENIAALLP